MSWFKKKKKETDWKQKYTDYSCGFTECRTNAIFTLSKYISECETKAEADLIVKISEELLKLKPSTFEADFRMAEMYDKLF